jgi:K+-transporting ATPase ATPase C chain
VEKEVRRLMAENPGAPGPVPTELVTASASGLDPHLSPEAVLWQVPRIAKARGIDPARIQAVVEAQMEGRDLWVLGEPRVNVLLVNLALDRHFGRPPK